jgi:hypothetical protein
MYAITSKRLEKAKSGARGTLHNTSLTLATLSLTQVNIFITGEKRWYLRENEFQTKRKERDGKGEPTDV